MSDSSAGAQTLATIETFCPLSPVSRETLRAYVALLLKWNRSINLIGKATEADIWQRHILDSAQLMTQFPANIHSITDLGSGGGLPSVVLSILGVLEVHAVESDTRKAVFLQEVARQLSLNLEVHDARIEALTPWRSDVVTARALAPLEVLLPYAYPFLKEGGACFFLKGAKAKEEIRVAEQNWVFTYHVYPSMVEDVMAKSAGFVLKIEGLQARL